MLHTGQTLEQYAPATLTPAHLLPPAALKEVAARFARMQVPSDVNRPPRDLLSKHKSYVIEEWAQSLALFIPLAFTQVSTVLEGWCTGNAVARLLHLSFCLTTCYLAAAHYHAAAAAEAAGRWHSP